MGRPAGLMGRTEPMANPVHGATSLAALWAAANRSGQGGVVVWQFSSDFADKQRDRVESLTAWRSFGEIVDTIVEMWGEVAHRCQSDP
jgi:hypothetical protein